MSIFKHQLWHLLILGGLLIALASYVTADGTVLNGELWGISTYNWMIFTTLCAIVHQLYVLVCWRSELHYQSISGLLGQARLYDPGSFSTGRNCTARHIKQNDIKHKPHLVVSALRVIDDTGSVPLLFGKEVFWIRSSVWDRPFPTGRLQAQAVRRRGNLQIHSQRHVYLRIFQPLDSRTIAAIKSSPVYGTFQSSVHLGALLLHRTSRSQGD